MLHHENPGSISNQPAGSLLAQLSRHVVVGLDGPNAPLAPVLLALDIAEAGQGSLDVLLRVDDPATLVLPFGRRLALASWIVGEGSLRRRRAHDTMRAVVKAASAREVLVTARPVKGALVERLEEAALPASLLVLHRREQDDPLVAVMARLIRRTHLPVLAAPQGQQTLQRVVVALDRDLVAGAALQVGAALATGLGLPFTVYTVGDAAARARVERLIRPELRAAGVKARFRGRLGQPAELIAQQALPNSILVMGAYQGRTRPLALGGVTETVLRRSHGPLLLVPPGRDIRGGL